MNFTIAMILMFAGVMGTFIGIAMAIEHNNVGYLIYTVLFAVVMYFAVKGTSD